MGNRIEIARAFVRSRKRSRWTAKELDEYQARHVSAENSPIETAVEFERRFAQRNALGLTMEQARVEAERELAGEAPRYPGFSFGFSTGTMGRPGVFLTSERERSSWVGTVLGKFLPLRMLAGTDVALVLKHNNRLYTDVRQTRRLRLHYFNASAPVADWAGELCDLAPDVLIGPPSILERVARSAAFERRPFRPELLLAGAEPMFPQDAAVLAEAYRVAPRVIYQAKEGFLGAGCEFGSLHLNEDLICFEAVSLGDSRFIPVITDFTRTSQRYIRFRLDDVLVGSSLDCACKQPFARVAAVEGRANDVLLLNHQRIFPLEINELLLPHVGGADYRVTQHAGDRVTLAVESGASDGALAALAARVQPVIPSLVEYEPLLPGEKRRRVRREFDRHNEWLNRLTVSRNVRSGW